MHPYDLILTGLAIDVTGAVVLAKGFMMKHPQAAYYEGLMILGGNNHLLKSAILQRAEAWVGGGLLIAGFVMQIWGNLRGGVSANELGWINSTPRMVVILAAAVAFASLCLRIALRIARAQFFRIFFRNYKGQTQLHPQADDATWFDRTARLYDLPRRRGEEDGAFLTRLENRRVEFGKRYGGQARDFLVNE
jgi:hypothetical protein